MEKHFFNLNPTQDSTSKNIKPETEVEKDPNTDFVFENPKILSDTRVNYSFPELEGRELKPGHNIKFVVPNEFKNRIVRDVILRHRKDPKYSVDIGLNRHDPNGAYSRVELFDYKNNKWVGWKDPKGYSSDKFAESRSSSDPEEEVLHDWLATVGPIEISNIRVTNVGMNKEYSVSQIHGLEVVFFPEIEDVVCQEKIYCSGTEFIDIKNNKLLPDYGGGSTTEGIYKGAIALNQSKPALYELGKDPGPNAKVENGKMFIHLNSGQKLIQVEVAIGDTEHLDYINPKTNRKTRLGYAKLRVGIKRAKSGNIEWFIENANIPPQGVIAGGPHLENSMIEVGDELVLESQKDTSYLMGWKLSYKSE